MPWARNNVSKLTLKLVAAAVSQVTDFVFFYGLRYCAQDALIHEITCILD